MRSDGLERLVLETRSEALALVSSDAAVRRGESDRFEIGGLASSDVVDGQEAQHTGGDHVESAHAHTVRAARLETRVGGKMSLRAHSDTTLLGGAMAETHAGPVLLMAGMSDSLVAGGGMRVSLADLSVAGLIGMEEKIGSALADGALVEAYATHFEREYGPGNHTAGFAAFTGTVHLTSASGFRPLFKVASGVRNLTAGGGGGAGPEGPAGAPAPAPPPPVASPTGRPSDGGLIGDTPEFAGIYALLGDVGDAGGDASRALGDADDLAADDLRHLDETIAGGGTEVSRGADTADVLSDLRAAADLQGNEDARRIDILDLLDQWNELALPDEVDQHTAITRLDEAKARAGANALANLDAAAREVAQNEAVHLYGWARAAVEAGEDPQPLLDRLAAIYRWRAEHGVEAYPNQADAVADIRASVDAVLRDSGYRGAVGADDALDADLLARVEDLFNSADETAAATEDLSPGIRDVSAFDDFDQGTVRAPLDEARTRDPGDLTLPELEVRRSDRQDNWVEALSPRAEQPAKQEYVPDFHGPLERWDAEITGLVDWQLKPPLESGDQGARAKLLEDLRSAEAVADGNLEKWPAARNRLVHDVMLDRADVPRIAADAVAKGQDPLPALNDLVEVYRWRSNHDALTYNQQLQVIEEARDRVVQVFRNNGFSTSTEVGDPNFLTRTLDLFENPETLRAHLRKFDDAPGEAAALGVQRADLTDDVRVDRLLDGAASESDGTSRIPWQGQAVDADGLTDLSTNDAYQVGEVELAGRFDGGRPNPSTDDAEYRVGEVPFVPFPFQPPRLPDNVDANSFIDFVQTRRDALLEVAGQRPGGATPADVRLREEIRAYDLALDALSRGDDPRPLIDDRLRSARIRQVANTPLVEDEVGILSEVQQRLRGYFDTVRDSAVRPDQLAVDDARSLDQLRVETLSSLADGEPAADDYVRLADVPTGGDTSTRPVAYADVEPRTAPVSRPELDTRVTYSEVRTGGAEPVRFRIDESAQAPAPGLRGDVAGRPRAYARVEFGPGPKWQKLNTSVNYSDVTFDTATRAQALAADQSRYADRPLLRFLSDEPSRLAGSLQGDGPYTAKPLFQVTESEFAAIAAGYLDISVLDATSYRELGRDEFALTRVARTQLVAEPTDLTAAADLAGLGRSDAPLGRSRSLSTLAASSDSVEVSASGFSLASPQGGSLSTLPPSAGGAARPQRPRPVRYIGGEVVPIQGPIPRGGW